MRALTPRGLIDYCTLDDAAIEKAGGTAPPVLRTLFRPRTFAYLGIWAAIGFAMLFTLGQRTRLDLSVQQDRNPIYVQLSDGMIRNNYTVKIRNMETRPRTVLLQVSGLAGAQAWLADSSRSNASAEIRVPVEADSVKRLRLFVAAPAAGPQREEFTVATQGLEEGKTGDADRIAFERPPGEDSEEEE